MEKWKKIWQDFRNWPGWRPHWAVVLLLSALTIAGLTWVFTTGRDYSLFAYPIYGLSAYSLTVLLVKVPGMVAFFKKRSQEDGTGAGKKPREDGAFDIGMYVEQFINFCYGGFKVVMGTYVGSAWIGADGLYNFTQGVIQLYQILRHRNTQEIRKQWKVYRRCGYMMILVNLTMTGLVFQMIQMGRHEDNTEIGIITTATFTFYKLVKSILELAKDRKHKNPVDSAVYLLDFGQALYNLFVLQVGLLWVFGGTDYPYQYLMNSLTGTAVCILVCGIGIYMLWRSKRDMKRLEEETQK